MCHRREELIFESKSMLQENRESSSLHPRHFFELRWSFLQKWAHGSVYNAAILNVNLEKNQGTRFIQLINEMRVLVVLHASRKIHSTKTMIHNGNQMKEFLWFFQNASDTQKKFMFTYKWDFHNWIYKYRKNRSLRPWSRRAWEAKRLGRVPCILAWESLVKVISGRQ